MGLVISLRPSQDTISVWIRNGSDKKVIESVKEDIERFVKVDAELGIKLDYENFQEALQQKQERKDNFERAEKQ